MTIFVKKLAAGAMLAAVLGVAVTAHAQSPEQQAEAMHAYNSLMGSMGGAATQGQASPHANVMQHAMDIAQLMQKYLIQTVSTGDANQQAQIRTNAAAEVAVYYQKMGIPAQQAKGLADNMVTNVLENPQVLAKARASMGK